MISDIVYIYAHGHSGWREQELKYSLRSLEKHGYKYGKVFLVGDKPDYLNDKVIHIPVADNPSYCKERRIMEKILVACNTPDISKTFAFFNDDFMVVKPINMQNIPFYHTDGIYAAILKRKGGTYKVSLENTYNALLSHGLPTKHFDIHFPMYYDKELFPQVMGCYDWTIRAGYIIKSLYANTLGIEGTYKKDCKIENVLLRKKILDKIKDTELFSTAEISRAMIVLLNELYPEPSSMEV